MMQELLTKGIGHTKFKDSPVGRIPEEWEVGKIDKLGKIGRGKSKHRPRNDKKLFNGSYPFIQTGEVKAADLYIKAHSQTYSELGLSQSKLWDANTLCITIAANIADTALLSYPACFPDSIVGFTANPKISNPLYVKFYFDKLQVEMQAISTGTTQDNMSMEKMLNFNFAIPTLEEQNKISEKLVSLVNLVNKKEEKLSSLQSLKKGLMQDLLTGKVRVKV